LVDIHCAVLPQQSVIFWEMAISGFPHTVYWRGHKLQSLGKMPTCLRWIHDITPWTTAFKHEVPKQSV